MPPPLESPPPVGGYETSSSSGRGAGSRPRAARGSPTQIRASVAVALAAIGGLVNDLRESRPVKLVPNKGFMKGKKGAFGLTFIYTPKHTINPSGGLMPPLIPPIFLNELFFLDKLDKLISEQKKYGHILMLALNISGCNQLEIM